MITPKLNSSVIYMEETVIPAVGTIGATLYQRFAHWCRRNEANKSKRHYKDQRWWTWDSYPALSGDYPYWTSRQIRLACDKLRQVGLVTCKIKKGSNYWYSTINIEDWIDSEKFKKLDLVTQNQVLHIVRRRDLVLKSCDKNVRGSDKNVRGSDKNVTPNTVNNTVTLPVIEESKNQKKIISLSDKDLTKEEELKITYNNLIIDDAVLTHMYDSYDSFFETIKRKSGSEKEAVTTALAAPTFLNEHPVWLRLIFAKNKGLLEKYPFVKDFLQPRLISEIHSNPGIADILKRTLGEDFDYSWSGINIKSEIRYQQQLLKKIDKTISKQTNRLSRN
jgi:hypothetical protein